MIDFDSLLYALRAGNWTRDFLNGKETHVISARDKFNHPHFFVVERDSSAFWTVRRRYGRDLSGGWAEGTRYSFAGADAAVQFVRYGFMVLDCME